MAKNLDGTDDSIDPSFSAEEAEAFFKQVYSSSPRQFQRPEWLPTMKPPQYPFKDDPIKISEINEVIKRTKSSSAPSQSVLPGLQKMPYTSYCSSRPLQHLLGFKNCPFSLETRSH